MFFPRGFAFWEQVGFLWHIAWTFCWRPDLWQALQVFEKTSASFDGEQKVTKHNFFMCVCGHILWKVDRPQCKMCWEERDGFWQLLVWDQIILIDYFSHRESSSGWNGMFSEWNHKWKYQLKWEISTLRPLSQSRQLSMELIMCFWQFSTIILQRPHPLWIALDWWMIFGEWWLV